MDLLLKSKQAAWEAPRRIAILAATVAAVAGALGYRIGQQPAQPIVTYLPAPGVSGAPPVSPLPGALR